jgi:hypothetical protein
MVQLTPEALLQVAHSRGVPLSPQRAEALLKQVEGLFAFTRELDGQVAPEVMPATVFNVDE